MDNINKICQQCHASFVVTSEDQTFYHKVSPIFGGQKHLIPDPKTCPSCRDQLRLSWKNERKLYQQTCKLCQKPTLAIYSPQSGYTPYCPTCFWSDDWDSLEYGQTYDPSSSFFGQFGNLLRTMPKQALHHNNNENCPYTTSTTRNKNCYLISSSGINEDCYYGIFLKSNTNCVDNTHILDSQLCYECLDTTKGYHLQYCQNTNQCIDSAFLYDCSGCQNCFFSYGLRNQQYVFANERLTKEQYEAKMAQINLESYAQIQDLKQKFKNFIQDCPRLYYDGQNNEEVNASNHIFHSKNCSHCIDADYLEDCHYCGWLNHSIDCQDCYSFGYRGVEQCYQCLEIGDSAHRLLFCLHCWNVNADLTYCYDCHGCQDCFGCVGLKQKKYCILNTQYTKDTYHQLAAQIVQNMINSEEWGQFLPNRYAPFGYNETMADDLFHLTKAQAIAGDWQWYDHPEVIPKAQKIIEVKDIPDTLENVTEKVLDWAFKCKQTGKPFKIIRQELDFYRKQKLPLPRLHPEARHKARFTLRHPRTFGMIPCHACEKSLWSSYTKEEGKKIYCEACYLKIVHG